MNINGKMLLCRSYDKKGKNMIRILHVVTYMGRGGLETMLMNYYRHIDRSKVQFDFLVHRDFEADYDEEIRNLGGRIYYVSRLVPWSRGYRQELKRFFKKHTEYKIVHVHQDCLSSVALQCAKECGIPVRIAHSHNNSQDKNWKYLVKMYYKRKIPRYATHLFACNEAAGAWMFGRNEFKVIYNAIDIQRYEYSKLVSDKIKQELSLANNIIVGHVGRFRPQKNHVFLIDVFNECLKINSNMKLVLVGDGEEEDKIRKKVHEMGIDDHVLFTGARSDVNQLMQAMNVFVLPSLYEGLPVTMIEAQTAGISCVISDRVSEECIVTKGLVSSVSLEEPPKIWAEKILQRSKKTKEKHGYEIKEAGYDIATSAKELELFYLQQAEGRL